MVLLKIWLCGVGEMHYHVFVQNNPVGGFCMEISDF